MSTFLADMIKKVYTEDEVFGVLFESERERRRRRLQAIVTEEVAAHNLKKMNELLTYQELVIWKRENEFDRVGDGEDDWFHGPRPLPPTPEQLTQSLWSEVNALKEAISMLARTPWQKTMEFVDRLQGRLPDEEIVVIKRYVERRSREAAQVTAVTRGDTVQHCSPISQTPVPPSGVYFNLENNEDEMGPELEKLKSSSAGTGLETPGQQCPTNEGVWESGGVTANGFLTAGVDSRKKENISSSTERATRMVTVAGISSIAATSSKRSHKTFSEEN